ncbi:unnamed protein product [Prunus brigantina]
MILEHEIDKYITDPIEDVVNEFDVLKWWKLNGVGTYCKGCACHPGINGGFEIMLQHGWSGLNLLSKLVKVG